MGKLDSFLEKIGWTQADQEDDGESYEEPKEFSYPAEPGYWGDRNREVRLSTGEEGSYMSRRTGTQLKTRSAGQAESLSTPKVMNLHASVQMEVVVASPESFEEAKGITDDLRNNKPVVINLEFVEHPIAQRITDFLCGACYALGGNVQQIADKIYMIAPGNVDIAASSDFRRTLQNESGLVFPWNQDR